MSVETHYVWEVLSTMLPGCWPKLDKPRWGVTSQDDHNNILLHYVCNVCIIIKCSRSRAFYIELCVHVPWHSNRELRKCTSRKGHQVHGCQEGKLLGPCLSEQQLNKGESTIEGHCTRVYEVTRGSLYLKANWIQTCSSIPHLSSLLYFLQ